MTAVDQFELAELRDMIDSFTHTEVASKVADIEAEDAIGPETVHALVDSGLWGIGLPEAIGGQGADLATALFTIRRVARVNPAVAMALAHGHAAATGLLSVGDVERAGAIAAGQVAVIAVEDPAEADAGQIVLPRLDLGLRPAKALILLTRERRAVCTAAPGPGVRVRRSGLSGLGTHRVVIAAAELDSDPEWTGAQYDLVRASALRWWRLAAAAAALGAAEAAANQAEIYVTSRQQFGAALREIATVARSLDAFQTTTDALWDALHRRMSWPTDPAAESDALLVHRITDASVRQCLAAIQLFGGYGYLREFTVEGLLRDAVSLRALSRLGE